MHTSAQKTLYLLSFDLDGTLTGPNYSVYGIFGKYEMLLKELQQLPGLEVVLNSGKPFHVLEASAARFGGRYVIACNGAAYKLIGGDQTVFGGNSRDLIKLRKLLGLAPHDEGVKLITINNKTYEMVIEEGKHHDVVLTIFCEPEWVKEQWTFQGGCDRQQVYDYLNTLIEKHTLKLHVLHPHGDGAVDIVRLHGQKPINKATLPEMVQQIWSKTPTIKIAMFGDGSNDVPAMTAEGVIGITFPEANDEKVKQPVLAHGGIVTKLPAWIKNNDGSFKCGDGVIEGVKKLALNGFFDDLGDAVVRICKPLLYKKTGESEQAPASL